MNRTDRLFRNHVTRRLAVEPLERRELLAGEVVELLLTARTDDDQPIAADENGVINLAVNEPFNLEVSYDDLRQPNDRDGVFSTDHGYRFQPGKHRRTHLE